ncbi:MAG: carboxypeptidase-like regulatory domain-containing protein [Anaerolineae bacterium]|nr:carboxypeptidase-like regulatory domain-containing protein [Anaerolineae bacterium]MDW8071529.1 carboxypeptidase-like regulatory domain-containing protein [Anaerolineae bacterium]
MHLVIPNPGMRGQIRTFARLAAIGLFVLMGAAVPRSFAQAVTETPRGILIGRVHNTTTQQPLAGISVRLRHWRLEVEHPSSTTQTDAQGHFRFEGLDTDVHSLYRAEVEYQGITFHSPFVSFEPGSTQASLVLNVYETSSVPEMIRIKRFHFIILMRERGILSILELYQFGNEGNHAFVGTPGEQGVRETVRMALPAGARDLTLQSGTPGVDFIVRADELVATTPLLPGEETFDVAFVYLVPYSTPSIVLDRRLYYDTIAVNGLLMDVGAEMRSDLLRFVGERTAQGQNFLQFIGENLKAGQQLGITLDHLDQIRLPDATAKPLNGEMAEPETMVPQRVSHAAMLWAMLALGGMMLAVGLLYPAWRARRTGLREEQMEMERNRLLFTLACLDEAYQAGQLSEAVYRRVRAHRKAELARIWRPPHDLL